LFQPSYTLASVIANEFTEATADIYLSSLIELGLILFFVTFVVNSIARLMVWRVTRKTAGAAMAVSLASNHYNAFSIRSISTHCESSDDFADGVMHFRRGAHSGGFPDVH